MGLSSLSLRELAQVSIGNILMGFQLVAMAALACTGGIAVVEHPAESPNPDDASIWRTPIMQLLLALPECESFTLAQGLWGGAIVETDDFGCAQRTPIKNGTAKGPYHHGSAQRQFNWERHLRKLGYGPLEGVSSWPLSCTCQRIPQGDR